MRSTTAKTAAQAIASATWVPIGTDHSHHAEREVIGLADEWAGRAGIYLDDFASSDLQCADGDLEIDGNSVLLFRSTEWPRIVVAVHYDYDGAPDGAGYTIHAVEVRRA